MITFCPGLMERDFLVYRNATHVDCKCGKKNLSIVSLQCHLKKGSVHAGDWQNIKDDNIDTRWHTFADANQYTNGPKGTSGRLPFSISDLFPIYFNTTISCQVLNSVIS